ncbi:MAG: type II toxin-antitoxin system Phd/YefM family antitoxin [Sciscionella sp.]
MELVPVRELNQDTAGVLARVKNGEHLDITERGDVVAHLVPAQPNQLAALAASGNLVPPSLPGPLPRPTGPVRREQESGELLHTMRDKERY